MTAAELRAAFDVLAVADRKFQIASSEEGREQAQRAYEHQLATQRTQLYESFRNGRRA